MIRATRERGLLNAELVLGFISDESISIRRLSLSSACGWPCSAATQALLFSRSNLGLRPHTSALPKIPLKQNSRSKLTVSCAIHRIICPNIRHPRYPRELLCVLLVQKGQGINSSVFYACFCHTTFLILEVGNLSMLGCRQVVRQQILILSFAGSTPATPSIFFR